jgi:hypothetical protein
MATAKKQKKNRATTPQKKKTVRRRISKSDSGEGRPQITALPIQQVQEILKKGIEELEEVAPKTEASPSEKIIYEKLEKLDYHAKTELLHSLTRELEDEVPVDEQERQHILQEWVSQSRAFSDSCTSGAWTGEKGDSVTGFRLPNKLKFKLELAARKTNTTLPELMKWYLQNALDASPEFFSQDDYRPLVDKWGTSRPWIDDDGVRCEAIETKEKDLGELLWHPMPAMQMLKVAIARPEWMTPQAKRILSMIGREPRFWHRPINANDIDKHGISLYLNKPNVFLIQVNMLRLQKFSKEPGSQVKFMFEPPEAKTDEEHMYVNESQWHADSHEISLNDDLERVKSYVKERAEDTY